MELRYLALLLLQTSQALVTPPSADYHVGVGIFDVTGPAAEVVLQGYASSEQKATGIHMRLHARAFIFVDPANGERVAFINVDTWSATEDIIQGLEARLFVEFQGLYTRENVVVAGTHTHAAPGGTSSYMLFEFSSFGHIQQSVDALVDGMLEAMKVAHGSIKPANVFIGDASVDNTTVPGCPMPNCAARNRSPTAYKQNPATERAKYDGDVEKTMDLVKIVDARTGEAMGSLNWFAVHPTSMRRQSGLISGDNKGYAAYRFERSINGPGLSGRGPFVAAFAQGAAGDISPNINGSFCVGTSVSCDTAESVCYDSFGQPHNSQCLSVGPGRDMFESTEIIGERQFLAAEHAFHRADKPLGRGVDSRLRFVDMTRATANLTDGRQVSACPAAMGVVMAAGTTDGPSDMDDFAQHTDSSNPFLVALSKMLATPPEWVANCHHPKSILLYTAGLHVPYDFVPSTMRFQLLRIGQLVIAAVPGEFTTMAGRRTREAIKEVLVQRGVLGREGVVVLNNCAGGYADYVTTFEEYQHQRYEAGSTAYGPHTHAIWTQILLQLAEEMASGTSSPSLPPVLPSKLMETQPGVVVDYPPVNGQFGDVRTDVVQGSFVPGDKVQVEIWGAHPRNNLRLNQSFASVWRLDHEGWQPVADDNDPETVFEWRREGISASIVTLTWYIPLDATAGNYTLHYTGDAKRNGGQINPISGSSRLFEVLR